MPSECVLFSFVVRHEQDVVTSRQRAAQIAGLIGFDVSEQTRIATAVSEIVRNAYRYAGGGRVEFALEGSTLPQLLQITVADSGPGIANLPDVLSGRYRSNTGLGMGLAGSQRLMDQFQIVSSQEGTTVLMKKLLPRRAPFIGPSKAADLVRRIDQLKPTGLIQEIQRQNQELLRALEELQRRQDELARLNQELEDTNRGVVALYAELDERADHLRRADELKSRFLSNMTHEFRTPVNAILALSDLLQQAPPNDRRAPRPELAYIRKSAEQLSELVNDLLDLAKVEAGKTTVRVAEFEVANLFGALRGMLRPLLVNRSVALVFDDPVDLPTLKTDEAKVSQILRNFISNALKFTEKGEVRISAALDDKRGEIVFTVADTGIGVAPGDLTRIFDEFVQIENRLQPNVKGTGLGLPLSKRLAELLGGRVWVESQIDVGSCFSVAVPIAYREQPAAETLDASLSLEHGRLPILVLEDAFADQLFYEKILKDTPYHMIGARSVATAREIVQRVRPAAMILDVLLETGDVWDFLTEVKAAPATRSIPTLIISTVDDARKGLALGADVYVTKPIQRQWLLNTLDALVGPRKQDTVLVVDDQDAARYIMRQFLGQSDYIILEARTGDEALACVRDSRPDVVLLDLGLGDMDARSVLSSLKADPETARIPVIVVTSSRLSAAERAELGGSVAAVMSKDTLNRDGIRQAIRNATSAAEVGHGER